MAAGNEKKRVNNVGKNSFAVHEIPGMDLKLRTTFRSLIKRVCNTNVFIVYKG